MKKIMGVRLVVKIRYLEIRLAGRAGATGRSIIAGHDPGDDRRPAGHTPLWVLPGEKPYTGAEGAEDVKHSIFSPPFCFCSDFGR